MSTLIVIFAGFIVVLIIFSKIPGLDLMVKPLIDLLFNGIKLIATHSVIWGIWLFKTLWGAHAAVIVNAINSEEKIDPTVIVHLRQRPSLDVIPDYFPWMMPWMAKYKKWRERLKAGS